MIAIGEPPATGIEAQVAAARASARRSNVVAVASLLLACVALLSGQRQGVATPQLARAPRAAAAAAPPEKKLDPSREYVTLKELAVFQDQINEGAVGTPEIADGAVTYAKLDVQMKQAVTAATSLVSGEVSWEGKVVRGAGFTCERTSAGHYDLAFDVPFPTNPVVVTVANGYAVCYSPHGQNDKQHVQVHCMSDLLTNVASDYNIAFSFMAVA